MIMNDFDNQSNEIKNEPIEGKAQTEQTQPEKAQIEQIIQNQHPPVYKWTFSDQYIHDQAQKSEKKKSINKGAGAYAIIMTIAFVVSLALLVGTMFIGNGIVVTKYQDRTIFVRDLTDDSGLLTVPEISVKCNPSVVCITTTVSAGTGMGTGIIKSNDGYIITNYHVVEGYKKITVTLYNGTEYNASFIGGDETADIALIRITAPDLVPATFGESDNLIQGEDVVAIGMPAGIEYGWSITKGIISGINRDVEIYDGTTLVKTMTVIQTDTTINKGNSGGPLINYYGEVIGINTLKLADDYENMGFAIPIHSALAIVEDILENGTGYVTAVPEQAAIGIQGQEVEINDGYDVAGILITSFIDSTCDASQKLQVGDIICGIAGTTVTTIDQVRDILSSYNAGDSIEIEYYRNGSRNNTVITLTSN